MFSLLWLVNWRAICFICIVHNPMNHKQSNLIFEKTKQNYFFSCVCKTTLYHCIKKKYLVFSKINYYSIPFIESKRTILSAPKLCHDICIYFFTQTMTPKKVWQSIKRLNQKDYNSRCSFSMMAKWANDGKLQANDGKCLIMMVKW